jgi:hypothetical protein
MSGSPQWYLSLRFPHQNPVHTSPLPHTCHMPRPSHSVSECYRMKLFINDNVTYCNEKQTVPGAYPAPYTVGTGSFSGVKLPGRDVNLQPPCRTKVKERVDLYLYSPSLPSWRLMGWNFIVSRNG